MIVADIKNQGFTLIELLVVISIIGFLAVLALVSFDKARANARDARRLAEIKQVQKALELYYDKNNAYPISGNCNSTVPSGWCNDVEGVSGGHWIRNGATVNLGEFLRQDPIDPKPVTVPSWPPIGGGAYYYYANGYGGAGKWYMIVFGLENRNHSYQTQDGVTACDGYYFHVGNGSNGILTVGGNCVNR